MDRRRLFPSRRPLGVRDRVSRIGSGDATRRGLSPDESEHLRFVLDSYRTLTRHWQSLSEQLMTGEAPGSQEPCPSAYERE